MHAAKKSVVEELKKEVEIKLPSTKKQPVVHSTFRLSSKAHEAIKELSSVFGKHAVVFDDLVDGIKAQIGIYDKLLLALRSNAIETPPPLASKDPEAFALQICFGDGAENLIKKFKKTKTIKKAYVVRKDTIDALDKYKRQVKKGNIDMSRDLLIENIALLFKQRLDKEKANIPELYRKYLKEIESIWSDLEDLESNISNELVYDPFGLADKVSYELCGLMNLHQDLESFLAEEKKNEND